jgi:hypothetical protein
MRRVFAARRVLAGHKKPGSSSAENDSKVKIFDTAFLMIAFQFASSMARWRWQTAPLQKLSCRKSADRNASSRHSNTTTRPIE